MLKKMKALLLLASLILDKNLLIKRNISPPHLKNNKNY